LNPGEKKNREREREGGREEKEMRKGRKKRKYPSKRKLGGPQSQSRWFWRRENLLSLLG